MRKALGTGREPDPMEERIKESLSKGEVPFVDETHPDAKCLDFYLPDKDVHVEVKRFHSERITAQLARADNVILAQGEKAVELLASLLKKDNAAD